MKNMHFIVVEDGAMAGTGVVKQGVGSDKYLCEFPQQTGIRLSRIMTSDSMVDWLFFNNQNSLQSYMQSQLPPTQPDEPNGDEGMDDETPTPAADDIELGTPDDTPATTEPETPNPLDE